jgi:ParB-like chromosome segregation protein Spo0J
MDNENNDLADSASGGESPAPAVLVAFHKAADLVPYVRNARLHSDAQIAKLIGLMGEFGWTNPVLVEGRNIVAGHGRTMAALKIYADNGRISLPNKSLIPDGCVPCIDCTGWTEGQKRAYVLADNRSAEDSSWDEGLLGAEFADLIALGFDLEMTGFSDKELASYVDGGFPSDDGTAGGDAPVDSIAESWGVVVTLGNEMDQVKLLQELTERGYVVKALV